MEGLGNRSRERRGSSPELIDLDEEVERAPVVVDLEGEEEDDGDIIILDDAGIPRAVSPEIEILQVIRPPVECIELVSESDSEVEVLEVSPAPSPVVVDLEEEVTVEEVPSSLSLADVKEEDEAQVNGLADVMHQVTIEERQDLDSSSSVGAHHSGNMMDWRQLSPSSSFLDPNCAANSVEDSIGEVMEGGNIPEPVKTRIVYVSKPDFTSLSYADKSNLRVQLLRQIEELQKSCTFGLRYQRRYPPEFLRIKDGVKTMMKQDRDGVLRKLVFRPAERREADERKIDPAFELPPRPTPSFVELLLKKRPAEDEELAMHAGFKQESLKVEGPKHLDEPRKAVPSCFQEEYRGPVWDTQEDVDEFCRALNEVFDDLAQKREEEKKAKEAARILEKENRKKAQAALLAEFGIGGRKKTRLATGSIARKNFTTAKEVGGSSIKSSTSPAPLQHQPRKRKGSETDTASELEFSSVPTLHRRPVGRPVPSESVISTLPPPPPLPNQETFQSTEERPLTCPLENDAGWIQEDEWEIEGIVDVRVEKNELTDEKQVMYKVKWRGWESKHNSWVPEKNILSKTPIKAFWRKIKKETVQLNLQIRKAVKGHHVKSAAYFMP